MFSNISANVSTLFQGRGPGNGEAPHLIEHQTQISSAMATDSRPSAKLEPEEMMRILRQNETSNVTGRPAAVSLLNQLIAFKEEAADMMLAGTHSDYAHFPELDSTINLQLVRLLMRTGPDITSDFIGRLSARRLQELEKVIEAAPRDGHVPKQVEFSPQLNPLPTLLLQIRSQLRTREVIDLGRIGSWTSGAPEQSAGFRDEYGAKLSPAEIVAHLAVQETREDRAHIVAAIDKLFRDYSEEKVVEVRDMVAARSKNGENGDRWVYVPILNELNARLKAMSQANGNGKSE